MYLLDQRFLPHQVRYLKLGSAAEVAEAIRSMAVRGAPLIGVAAAYGMALAALAAAGRDRDELLAELEEAGRVLASSRPTAVNLARAVERVLEEARRAGEDGVVGRVLACARRIEQEEEEASRRMARHGANILPSGPVLTICNTGSLAAGGEGTALGVILEAWRMGKVTEVLVLETRPLLQGSRLTAWELGMRGVPYRVLADGAAGLALCRGMVSSVVVGADRISASGDVANKVGTYPLAVVARRHGVPFYVVAPTSTLDLASPAGEAIPIEERGEEEVLGFAGARAAPEGARAWNPAFDITPAELVSALITEVGVISPPLSQGLAALGGSRVQEKGRLGARLAPE